MADLPTTRNSLSGMHLQAFGENNEWLDLNLEAFELLDGAEAPLV